MSPTQDGPTTNIFMLVSYASRFSQSHIFRYAFGNGFERFVIARFAQVSQIRLSERLVAAFQFVRERDVLDAAFLWYARVASATAWKDSARPVPRLKMPETPFSQNHRLTSATSPT